MPCGTMEFLTSLLLGGLLSEMDLALSLVKETLDGMKPGEISEGGFTWL